MSEIYREHEELTPALAGDLYHLMAQNNGSPRHV